MHVADPSDSINATVGDLSDRSDHSSDAIEFVRTAGVLIEKTFIHYPFPKECSETSDVLQSAPGGTGKEPVNPRRWAAQPKSNSQ